MKRFITLVSIGAAAIVCAAGSASAANLLFSLDHNHLGAAGSTISTWDGLTAYTTYNNGGPLLGPTVEEINGVKWEKNTFSNYIAGNPPTHARQDGFQQGNYRGTGVLSDSGASIVVAARPIRNNVATSWTSIVDIFYDQLSLGIRNNTGKVFVRRNGQNYDSAVAIESGQAVILSIVAQADGAFKVWANDALVMEQGASAGFTLNPDRLVGGDRFVDGHSGDYSKNPDGTYKYFLGWQPAWNNSTNDDRIQVGRGNQNDTWAVFNGNIGDVKVWTGALTESERLAQVAAVSQSMGLSPVPEPGTLLALGALLAPAGMMLRRRVK